MGKKASLTAIYSYRKPRNIQDCKEAFHTMEVDIDVNEKQDKMKHIG